MAQTRRSTTPKNASAAAVARRERQRAAQPAPIPAPAPAQGADAMQTYRDRLAAVNLDEIIDARQRVAIKYRTEAGTIDHRLVEVVTDMPMPVLAEAMTFQERKDTLSPFALANETVRLVLLGWQVTEPEMTEEALTFGLSFLKIAKLYTVFFG